MPHKDVEKRRAYHRAYSAANLGRRQEYSATNRLTINGKKRKWRLENRERLNAQKRKWCKANKAKLREQKQARAYGISVERVREIVAPAKCAICGDTRRLHIDHDHLTGRVRELLCTRCNVGIGYFREDETLLFKAAEYLRKHGSLKAVLA